MLKSQTDQVRRLSFHFEQQTDRPAGLNGNARKKD